MPIKKVATDKFIVQSDTTTTQYVVDITAGACSCPHYQFRLLKTGGQCKHYKQVMDYLDQKVGEDVFSEVIKHIKKVGEDWNTIEEKFGEDIIKKMLQQGLIYKKTRDKLGVLE